MTEPDDADWDPPSPAARQLVRSAQTGELGYLVRRGGASMVKLDNPNQEILRRYTPADWLAEDTQRPLALIHVARYAFEADKLLCRDLGMVQHSLRSWDKLREGERQMFLKEGPKKPPARAVLYRSIMTAMKEFVRE